MIAWTVYMVRCADGTLYTGTARDAARRVEEHNSSDRLAASYTRARRPVVLVYREGAATRSEALRREYQIKQMSRVEKERLIGPGARRKPSPVRRRAINSRLEQPETRALK